MTPSWIACLVSPNSLANLVSVTSETLTMSSAARERNSLFQQLEIDRILSAFRLNPYDVLEVPLEADDKEINKIYRKKSLLIHPDKVKHGM